MREFELTRRCLKKWISIWSSDQRFRVQRTSSCGIMVPNGRNAFWITFQLYSNAFWGKNGWFCNENGFILLAYGWFCWHLIDFEIFKINWFRLEYFYTHTRACSHSNDRKKHLDTFMIWQVIFIELIPKVCIIFSISHPRCFLSYDFFHHICLFCKNYLKS